MFGIKIFDSCSPSNAKEETKTLLDSTCHRKESVKIIIRPIERHVKDRQLLTTVIFP